MNIKFTSIALLCGLIISCNNNGQSISDGDSSSSKSELEKKITKRDFTVTRQNAYSDIFLDSNSVESFIKEKKLSDSLIRRVRSFYNARNFQFAWFSSRGLNEQGLTFWNIHNYESYSGDNFSLNAAFQTKMNGLIGDSFAVRPSDKSMVNTELMLTTLFIKYTLGNYEKWFVKRKEMERFIPIKKEDPIKLADSLINKKHKDEKYYEDVNNAYGLLKKELNRYNLIAKNGGWPQIPGDAKQFKRGSSSPAIIQFKKRLQLAGYMPAGDTTRIFNDTVALAVKRAQQSFGYKPDGIVSASLLKDLNVPAQKRVEQLLVNMTRMRWMPHEPEGRLILVNIPEFVLHFFEGKNKVFDMPVVVGKVGNNTMQFTGKLSTIVFSPYWNVPPSITKKELEPAIARNANYLEKNNMERTPDGGIRQRPGDGNALGRVKFLFPNSFNIYFHDTPSKSLFSRDKRAFSHGCIRLSDPVKMAEYLLKDDRSWPPEKIMDAMNSGNEKFVKLKESIPVFITYYTAWVDETGLLNFRDDVYKRDAVVAQKMFASR
jgi:murein L,D-transpeptidase YcbB/YkuD